MPAYSNRYSNWRDRRLLDAGLPGTGSTRLVLAGLVTVELVAQPPERVSMVMSAAPKLASLLGVVGGNTTDQREPRLLRRTRGCCRWARAAGLWPY